MYYTVSVNIKQPRRINDTTSPVDNVAHPSCSKTRMLCMPCCYAFLPRFDPIGVFCNVNPAVPEPTGLTAPNVVDNAGVLPNRPLLLVVGQNAPKPPTS